MEIKIYVANLAAYVAGHLVGEWITLPLPEGELNERIQGILDAWNDGFTPSEEVAIHDYESPFQIGEYTPISQVNEWAEILSDCSEDDEVISAILGNYSSVDGGLEILQNGEYHVWNDCDDMADIAYQSYEESGQLAEIEKVMPSYYIDWDAIGRDMEIKGTFIRVNYNTFAEIIG